MIIIAILFIILAILIKYGKMYFLIAGYNTMSKEEKENYDIVGIANVFWKAMLGMAFVILAGYITALFTGRSTIQNYTFGAAIIVGVSYLLIQSNSKKYKKSK
jgi:hypothetical protein